MSWDIEVSDAAHEDLRDIYAHIAFELRSPENARNVLRRILAQIATLDEMPERFRSYPRDPLHAMGVRVMDVGNFCVYYIPKDRVVSIGRILYSRRNADGMVAEFEDAFVESRQQAKEAGMTPSDISKAISDVRREKRTTYLLPQSRHF